MSKKVTVVYGVKWLAKQTGYSTHTIGMKLRAAGVKKDGKMYSFKTKAAAQSIIKKIQVA